MEVTTVCPKCFRIFTSYTEEDECRCPWDEYLLIPWDDVAKVMDDETREKLHLELAPCTEVQFLSRYLELDPDFVIY